MSTNAIHFISTALECAATLISEESEFGVTPEWDSLGQINIMIALERDYGIEINKDSINYYTTTKRISEITG